eukprot:TRINITY_DN1546_c0_g1_i1.p1 TRINITY_DN1546_c0_g1~~TRINITY_DN1546_c0_g1_i1.p1  ORF type:complete len:136 (+),score=26.53 TRINITY_DN1546_c0_g1_i1:139-546(+)
MTFDILQWREDFFKATDAMDTNKWAPFWAETYELRFNDHKVNGKQSVREMFDAQFGLLSEMRHETIRWWYHDHTFFNEMIVHYRVKGDPENLVISIPAFAIGDVDEDHGVLSNFRIYLNDSELTKRIQYVQSLKK